MPYWGDPDFPLGLEDNQKVWRYINFEKYVDLLERKQQFFVSGSKLQEIDPYEGHFQKIKFVNQDRLSDEEKQLFDHMDRHEREEKPKDVFINCWHINEIESDAMWKIYAKGNTGIAIQTTIKKLKTSFCEYNQRVDIRKVEYVDNKKQNISVPWLPWRFSKKGLSFSHENELRIFVDGINDAIRAVVSEDGRWLGSDVIPQDQIKRTDRNDNGVWIPVNLSYFIETIHISPFSEKWFLDLVKSITKKYELDPNIVEKSPLYDNPNL